MSRPSDAQDEFRADDPVVNPRLGVVEWLRWAWRQLTSMRTALLLLLALAVGAVPGSLIPQESSDPNGVLQFQQDNPGFTKVVEFLQGFDVYSSVWFSAIYILLFVSLVGCVVPRVRHHWHAVRGLPPRTPSRFDRLPARGTARLDVAAGPALDVAERLLKKKGYRTTRYGASVSAERGYLRETGNLVFHSALVGVLVAVFAGGGLTYTGQKILVTGDTFVNTQSDYDTLTPGRFVNPVTDLSDYSLTLDRLRVRYDQSLSSLGAPLDYTATVSTREGDGPSERKTIKVNSPLDVGGTSVYLLGNGYAPHFTIRNADGSLARSASIPFRPLDPTLRSLGVVKVRNTTGPQFGFQGFLYPTVGTRADGEKYSFYPGLGLKGIGAPLVTLNMYEGRIGTDAQNAYVLDTTHMTTIAGIDAKSGVKALQLRIGQTRTLPNGLGTIRLDSITRYAAFDIHRDPTQGWVALFVVLAVLGLITSLLVPRRRMWVKVTEDRGAGVTVEYAALARGDDPNLARAVAELERDHRAALPAAVSRDDLVRS